MAFDLSDVSLKVSNYKCFGSQPQGFERILPMNIIIGRNNSGKTALLEIVKYATAPESLNRLSHGRESPEVLLSTVLNDSFWNLPPFEKPIEGHRCRKYAREHFTGKRIQSVLNDNGHNGFISIDSAHSDAKTIGADYLSIITNPFKGLKFRKLAADRDIKWEPQSGLENINITDGGDGATTAVEFYLNIDALNSDLIENVILGDMNRIFSPDTKFSRILVQRSQAGGGCWEINLEQPGKRRIPMQHTGSGIKTVLLVLLFIHIVPDIDKKPLSQFLFGFEELENNLHPAVQRRLFLFLQETAIESGCKFFVTTHSNVVIDLFRDDEQAQIIHIEHDGKESRTTTVSEFLHRSRVLNDLGARASDLLQAISIVWVEGPSDRLYFNRWIELFTDGQLREGIQYLCLIYGGSILSNYSFDGPGDDEAMIAALHVNRNAIVLIDSDKREIDAILKPRAERVAREAKETGGIGWLTGGREVENYIPAAALRDMSGNAEIGTPTEFEDVFAFLEDHQVGRFRERKVELARRVCPLLKLNDLQETLDLAEKMRTVCKKIRDWNGIS